MVEPSRRRAIEDVASDLFRERGYSATSVRDIARALDIQGASLYAHVTSKADVLWAIVDRAATRFETATAAATDRAASSSPGDRAAELAALVRAHVEVIAADPGDAMVFVHEWRALDPTRRAAILLRRDAYEGRFRDMIQRGIGDGTFRLTDPSIAGAFVLTALNGIAAWYRPEGRLGVDRIADHYADLTLRALTADHD